MSEFGLIKSFRIDDGELDGLRPKDCFVLGYELAVIDELVKRDDPISRPVHAENRERIAESFEKERRPYTLTWLEADPSENWMQLESDPFHHEVKC